MFDPIGALTLLWRGNADPAGAALWRDEDIQMADLLQIAGLGIVSKRVAMPHQRPLPGLATSEGSWITFFEPSDAGRELWSEVLQVILDVYTERLEPRSELYGLP